MSIISFFREIIAVPLVPFNKLGFILSILLLGCTIEKDKNFSSNVIHTTIQQDDVFRVIVNKSELLLKPEKGLVYHNSKPFTGISIEQYGDQLYKEKITYLHGKKHGISQKWFDHNALSFEATYHHGKKHGNTTTWWRNGNKRSVSYFENGVAQGKQYQWYQNGKKFKVLILVDGKEEGLQQSWRQNGKLFNNYEAKNGRIFGLKRSNLCYQLDKENTTASVP